MFLSVFQEQRYHLFQADFPVQNWTVTAAGGVFLNPRRTTVARTCSVEVSAACTGHTPVVSVDQLTSVFDNVQSGKFSDDECSGGVCLSYNHSQSGPNP